MSVPVGEKYTMLGDFNAGVESRKFAGDHWDAVRRPHGLGIGNINDAGTEVLSFLFMQQAMVYSTWLKKKDIHEQTWRHPKS